MKKLKEWFGRVFLCPLLGHYVVTGEQVRQVGASDDGLFTHWECSCTCERCGTTGLSKEFSFFTEKFWKPFKRRV